RPADPPQAAPSNPKICPEASRSPLPAGADRRPQETWLCGADRRIDSHAISRTLPRPAAVAHQPGRRLVRAQRHRGVARRAPLGPARPWQEVVGALRLVCSRRAPRRAAFGPVHAARGDSSLVDTPRPALSSSADKKTLTRNSALYCAILENGAIFP